MRYEIMALCLLKRSDLHSIDDTDLLSNSEEFDLVSHGEIVTLPTNVFIIISPFLRSVMRSILPCVRLTVMVPDVSDEALRKLKTIAKHFHDHDYRKIFNIDELRDLDSLFDILKINTGFFKISIANETDARHSGHSDEEYFESDEKENDEYGFAHVIAEVKDEPQSIDDVTAIRDSPTPSSSANSSRRRQRKSKKGDSSRKIRRKSRDCIVWTTNDKIETVRGWMWRQETRDLRPSNESGSTAMARLLEKKHNLPLDQRGGRESTVRGLLAAFFRKYPKKRPASFPKNAQPHVKWIWGELPEEPADWTREADPGPPPRKPRKQKVKTPKGSSKRKDAGRGRVGGRDNIT